MLDIFAPVEVKEYNKIIELMGLPDWKMYTANTAGWNLADMVAEIQVRSAYIRREMINFEKRVGCCCGDSTVKESIPELENYRKILKLSKLFIDGYTNKASVYKAVANHV